MGEKVISICKGLTRYDISLKKQEPIASDEPVISRGAIVSLRGHKGKVLQTEGDMASVSWEDAAISKVPIKDLKYEGRVEKFCKQMYDKDEVNYRPSQSRRGVCEGCYNFLEGLDPQECEIVEGVIKPDWVCDEFEKRYGD